MARHHSQRRERGQIVPVAALMMVAIIGFAAIILDGGRGYVDRRDLQAAADAGALSGVNQLGKNLLTDTPAFDVGCAVAAAANEVVQNLPATQVPSKWSYAGSKCPTLGTFNYDSKTTDFPSGADLKNGYTMDVVATLDTVTVTLHHSLSLTFGVAANFGPSITPGATATAVNGSIPFALVLFRNNTAGKGSSAPADLYLNGSGASLSIKGTGSNPGNALSNEGICPSPGSIDMSGSGGGNFYAYRPSFGAFPGSCGSSANINGAANNPLSFPIQLGDPGLPPPGPVNDPPSGCSAQPCSYDPKSTGKKSGPVCIPPGKYEYINLGSGTFVLQPGGVYEVTGSNTGSATNFHINNGAALYTADQLPGGVSDPCPAAADSGASVIMDPYGSAGDRNQLVVDAGGIFDITAPAAQNHIALYVRTPSGGACTYNPTGGCGSSVVNFGSSATYNIKGLIYGYADNMTFTSANTGVNGVGQVFAWTMTVSGNGTLTETYDPSFIPFLQGLLQ